MSCTHQLTLSSFSHRHPRDSCHSAASCSNEWKKLTIAVGSGCNTGVWRHWQLVMYPTYLQPCDSREIDRRNQLACPCNLNHRDAHQLLVTSHNT